MSAGRFPGRPNLSRVSPAGGPKPSGALVSVKMGRRVSVQELAKGNNRFRHPSKAGFRLS